MTKLIKLYNIILSNVGWLFLFVIFLFNSAFSYNTDKTNNSLKVVVIDPGHGGKDSGTMGTKRFPIYEKHVALAVALRLGKYITNAFPDIEVVYTRSDDVFLELNERTDIANNVNADLFLSIHCDGFTSPSPSGASVFVMGMSKLKANMDVAIRENSAIYLEDNYEEKYDGFDPKSAESYIVFSLMQNTHLNQSIQIATEIEKELSTRANRKSRGVKQAPFYVISRTNMPSILIECGFLTNPKEEVFLHSEEGQDYLASAIFSGFKAYKESVEALGPNKKDKEKTVSKQEFSKLDSMEINSDKVVFKIQLGTYLSSMLNNRMFIDINAQEYKINDTFKYYVGLETDKRKADILKNKMIANGFRGAFVVPFYKERRISMKEALDLQTKINNNE